MSTMRSGKDLLVIGGSKQNISSDRKLPVKEKQKLVCN